MPTPIHFLPRPADSNPAQFRAIPLIALFIVNCLLITGNCSAQPVNYPTKATPAGQILQNLRQLNVLGTVLYVAAHPDDENTLMLTYLANHRYFRTGYLALTRGDGGQNLIGAEQGELLGLIRTQELLGARRIDGPSQFFSRAFDFGFSKTTEEAVRLWGRDKVLADVVWQIRRFRPDVVITRFPPDARAGHGHHSASAALAEEAFQIANDPKRFPEQLAYVSVWQPKRVMWNTYNPQAFLSTKRPEDKGNIISVETGLFNPMLGKSYGEIAAESRSQHKSQGFGVPASRGSRLDYLMTKAGDTAQADLMDGVDVSWKRVPNSQRVQTLVNELISGFRADQPGALVPGLLNLYRELGKLDAKNQYVIDKKQAVEGLLQQCTGLFMEAIPSEFALSPGETSRVVLSAVNRSAVAVRLLSFRLPQLGRDSTLNLPLKPNEQVTLPLPVTIPATLPISQPYWLEKPVTQGLFQVADQQKIGLPENPPALTAEFTVEIDGQAFTFSRPWIYKSVDPVDGEVYRPLEIRPDLTANLSERVLAFSDNQPKPVEIIVKANRANASGTLRLEAPAGWRVEPASMPINLTDKFGEARVTVQVSPAGGATPATNGILRAVLTVNATANRPATTFSQSLRTISYKHIPAQTLFPPAETKLVRLDVAVTAKRVGYIMGAGDDVPLALRQMGCTVTVLNEADLVGNLSGYDAIVVGVRAYNTNEYMALVQPRLMAYVQNGGTLVVQYVTAGGPGNTLKTKQMGPFPFSISRERVTEEDAAITFLKPDHRLLTYPNKITQADFQGWIQERGIYFAQDFDKNYEALFSMHDTGEAEKTGSLIYTPYGKGHFIYTGLVFFRELPAGVPGAYRLMANLISVGK